MRRFDSIVPAGAGQRLALAILLAALACAIPSSVCAQEDLPEEAVEPTDAGTTAESDEAAKQEALDERVNEYLRKKEEKKARKERARQEKEAARAAELAAAGVIEGEEGQYVELPKDMVRVNEILRSMEIGQDPTVSGYLDLIDSGQATPQQLAAFGNFIAQNGMQQLALIYYDLALDLEREDPILWMNVGTLHRQLGELSDAVSAYDRALAIAPNNAFAHYNLGAVYDSMGKYNDAIEEYKIALTLDSSLGDPAVNSQAANNERLLAVKLMMYQEELGNLGLPLVDVPGGGLSLQINLPDEQGDGDH